MIYLKQTVAKFRDNFFSEKIFNQLQKNIVFQLVVLSTIKGYLYKSVTQQPLFIVPEKVLKNASKKKKILVLDMDQTLVYTRRESKPSHQNYKMTDYDGSKMYIEERPFLHEFLEAVSSIFEVYIYTAGNKQYADIVLNQVDKNQIIQKRFYRENCKKSNGNYYKDLKHLKRVSKSKAEMILIDDNTVSVGHNYPFSIKIKEFEGDQKDRQLVTIFQNLLKFYF